MLAQIVSATKASQEEHFRYLRIIQQGEQVALKRDFLTKLITKRPKSQKLPKDV
jgi:hypothetical protein